MKNKIWKDVISHSNFLKPYVILCKGIYIKYNQWRTEHKKKPNNNNNKKLTDVILPGDVINSCSAIDVSQRFPIDAHKWEKVSFQLGL